MEFKNTPSAKIKEQIRDIDRHLWEIEQEMWLEDVDTGREYIDPAADYMSSDLIQRRQVLVKELAKRIVCRKQ